MNEWIAEMNEWISKFINDIKRQQYKRRLMVLCQYQQVDLDQHTQAITAIIRTHQERVNLSRASKVMKKLIDTAVAKELLIRGTDVSTLSMNESDKVFDGAYMELQRELYSGEHYRAGAKSINTVANRLCKRKHSET